MPAGGRPAPVDDVDPRPGDGAVRFTPAEIRDLAVAWVALGIAFTLFFAGGGSGAVVAITFESEGILVAFGVSLFTAGVGFLIHELAHKVVAVRYEQIAHFHADYGMLVVAIGTALLGFLFAAPGAVYHRGHVTDRENGHIAIAGPIANLGLAALFAPLIPLGGAAGAEVLGLIGERGVAVNLVLASFNLIPVGGLDGRTVYRWSRPLWAIAFVSLAITTVVVVFGFGTGFETVLENGRG